MPRSQTSQQRGVAAEAPAEPGPRIRTSWLTDPDGYRSELVQLAPGRPAGMTAAELGIVDQ
jgi:lactoylglutathione lyase